MSAAPENIKQRVEVFARNIDAYKSGSMNETQLRREFIDPFFLELGWDVENKKGYADAYKDVIHEYSLKTKDVREAPDYCFRIGGTRKFFVETKKPSVNVKEDIHPAFQLRSYAWSAKLPLSILTDFEEFAVYDCRIPPNKKDKASTARVLYFTYEDYLTKWEEIEGIFSREAILKGSFDKYVESNKRKRGTAEVDEVFLDQMEEWRKLLAKNIALRNSSLSIRELNYAVQKTIDRIIFLRICEDRGIEDYGKLMTLQNGVNVYERLKQIYYRADEKYNSGLFHFEHEKERSEPPDKLTLDISIDDKVLKEIFKNLYYPDSPYEFSVLPADILGQVYEQFLGKVIRLTPAHYAVIEDKPEVKKAGGVFYTPTYIVDYIVQNTLGKILNSPPYKGGVSRRDGVVKKVSQLKILDPACGSGSFLIGAFQYLLDWHLKYYTADKKKLEKLAVKKNPPVYQGANGAWLLTTAEKKRILLNNIYGVDIDSQAVEVTKLSLLLKVLEGESNETIANQLKFFRERALPDLSDNIKCGNSLIGPDFYDQMKMNFLDEEEKLRINVFDWNTEFKEIMSNGGFDVVIGNPPYVKTQNLQEYNPVVLEQLKEIYYSAESGNVDIYVVFLEKSSSLLTENGMLGFIVPHKFFNSAYGKNLRKYLSERKLLIKILHFEDYQVFKNASTYTCLLFLRKSENKKVAVSKINPRKFTPLSIVEIKYDLIDISIFSEKDWNIQSKRAIQILERFKHLPTLEKITTNIFQGPKSGADNVFILRLLGEKGNELLCCSEVLKEEIYLEKELLKTYVKGKFINRYNINKSENEVTIYPYDDDGKLLDITYIKDLYPLIYKYLNEAKIKRILLDRERGRFKSTWWQYSRPQNMKIVFNKKILTPFNAFYNSFAYDEKGDFVFSAGVSGAYGILLKDESKITNHSLLGILNSQIVFFIIKNISTCLRGGYYSFENKYLKKLPIPVLEKDVMDVFNKIEHFVIEIIEHKTNILKAKTPQEKTALQRQIDATDAQIDKLVYELYGLSEKEIKIVEEMIYGKEIAIHRIIKK